MNFFGGSNCGDMGRDGGNMDCCSLIFLLLLLQNCGCGNGFGGGKGISISIDGDMLLWLIILSNCCGGCNK